MNNTDNQMGNSWEKIQNGVSDTERLIGQKRYNMAMIKARQTLEYMVKCLCERADIMEGNLIDMIDALYSERIITRITCEHYHKIRTIGNKAIHEDDNDAYNANQAHHLLSQEVYTFANDYSGRRKKAPPELRRQSGEPVRRSRYSDSSNIRSRRAPSSGSLDPGSIIKPLLLVAIIIVLIFIIKMIRPGREEVPETSSEPVSEASSEPTTVQNPEPTEEPTTAAPVIRYKTTDTLNVRSAPSTDSDESKIGKLAPGTEVEYVGEYNDEWCIIRYNGQEAYVSKQFLTPVE